MNNKRNTWIYIAAMIAAAVAEVSVTAVLVEKLGVTNLIGLYVITTGIGGFVIWFYYSKQKLIINKMQSMDLDTLPSTEKEGPYTPEGNYSLKLGMAIFTFWLAVTLIVIPGIVTDFLGLALLARWVANRTVREFDPSYVP
jgi:UPF0716 family protein affecting phage T7 exclusion